MAYEVQTLSRTFKAAGDLSSHQFKFMKMSANDTVTVCTGATDVPIGVLQNDDADAANKGAEVMLLGITKLESAAALSAGNLVGTSATGLGDAKTVGTDTTEFVVAQILESSSGAGVLCTAAINCLNPVRAA